MDHIIYMYAYIWVVVKNIVPSWVLDRFCGTPYLGDPKGDRDADNHPCASL